MSNNETVVVVESKGLSDKKIKLDSLKNSDGIIIDGDSIASYLSACVANDLVKELTSESRQDIGISRKPHIRYKAYKEKPAVGCVFSRSKINELYQVRIMENLKKINAPQVRFVLASFLSGETFTYESLAEYIKEKSGKVIKPGVINGCVASMTHSKMGFLLNKVGKLPATWQMDKRALEMDEADLYDLFLRTQGKMTIEDACLKYPFLVKILEEKKLLTESDKNKNDENENYLEPKTQEAIEQTDTLEPISMDSIKREVLGSFQKAISGDKNKFDLNINVNFRILFR